MSLDAPIVVGAVRRGRRNGVSRVEAEVDGTVVWFESADADLAPAPEAFGSAFLLPSMEVGRALTLEDPVDPRWYRGAHRVSRLFADWWDLRPTGPQAERRPIPTPRATARGGCFTCGIDSFHTCLRHRRPPSVLVTAVGYDVPLDDAPRIADLERRTRAVAAALDDRIIMVRSNVRSHPLFPAPLWPHSHGGALAALGHLARQDMGTLLVSSSWTRGLDIPWGSHFRADPHWSARGLRIRHLDHHLTRFDKVAALADEPLVGDHLLVCWERRTPTGNCGACTKCVGTLVMLAAAGHPDGLPSLRPAGPLADLVDALPPPPFVTSYREALAAGLPPDVERAVERLLDRSPPPERPAVRFLTSRVDAARRALHRRSRARRSRGWRTA